MRSRPSRYAPGAALLVVWALAKAVALFTHVFRPDEYSDTYYYFLQCQKAASGGGLAALMPEYPTPAAALLMLPWWLGAQDHVAYRQGFVAMVTVVDLAFVVLLIARTSAIGVVAWILLETLAGPVALLRFDLVPAALAAAAVLLLLQRREAAASGLIALGVAAKAWPALLFPLALGRRRSRPRAALAFAGVGALLAVVSVAAAGWERLISPLFYQRDRGLQIESVAATVPMLRRLGEPGFDIIWSAFNAYEIVGPTTPALLAATSVAAAGGVLAFVGLLVWWFRAGSPPDAAAYLALFAIAAFMVTSKALSPQYVLWLAAPAAVLVGDAWRAPDAARAHRAVRATLTFALVAALTALTGLVYPVFYDEILAGVRPAGVYLLAARNVLLVAFAAWCAWAAIRSAGAGEKMPVDPGW